MNSDLIKKILVEKIQLIEASAGTGKTYTICNLCILLLLGRNRPSQRPLAINEILILTFTIAATNELRTRIKQRICDAKEAFEKSSEDDFLKDLAESSGNPEKDWELLSNALHMIDDASIFTIHGFCARVLNDHAFESGALFTQRISDERSKLIQIACEDFFRTEIASLDLPIQKIALKVWGAPRTLEKMIKPFLYRSELVLLPQTNEHQKENLVEIAERIKKIWVDSNIQKIILESDLKKGSKPFRSAEQMTEFCSLVETDLTSEIWEVFSSDRLAAIKKNGTPVSHPVFQEIDNLIKSIDSFKAELKKKAFETIRKSLDTSQSLSNTINIDDLLPNVEKAISSENSDLKKKIANRWPVAMIDEFQDTDSTQYKIFFETYNQKNADTALLMIGDPKQAIYNFRGADIYTYINARRNAEKTHTLSENWRSTPDFVQAINDLFGKTGIFGNSADIPYVPISTPKERTVPEIKIRGRNTTPLNIFVDDEREPGSTGTGSLRKLMHHAAKTTAEILTEKSLTIGESQIKPEQIAFLVRTRKQAALAKKTLKEYGIDSISLTQDNIFRQQTAHDLIHILAATLHPKNHIKLKTALASSLLGCHPSDIDQLNSENGEARIAAIREFHDYQTIWTSEGVGRMIEFLIEKRNLAANLFHRINGKRQLTDLRHLSELLQERETRSPGKSELLIWLKSKYADEDQTPSEENFLRTDTDESLVRIVTMHASKGLEFDIVFIPAIFKKPFPENKNSPTFAHIEEKGKYRACLDFGNDVSLKERRRAEAFDEEIRLLYVSLTRAKYRCYLGLSGVIPGFKNSGIAKILSLDDLRNDESIYQKLAGSLPKSIYDLQRISIDHSEKTEGPGDHFSPQPIPDKPFINSSWRVHSYTAMTKNTHTRETQHRGLYDDEPKNYSRPGENRKSIHNFPRGPRTGIALHTLLEKADFESADFDSDCKKTISELGLEESWISVLRSWVMSIMNVNIGSARLKEIEKKDRIPELEFNFSLSSARNLTRFLKKNDFLFATLYNIITPATPL